MKILLAAYDAVLRHQLVRALEPMGVAVDEVADGYAALGAASANSHDLVIVDADLPGIAAVDVIRRLRCVNGSMPVIVLATGSGAREVESWSHRCGNTFIFRPIADAALVRGVAQLLAHDRSSAAAPLRDSERGRDAHAAKPRYTAGSGGLND